MSRVPVIPTVLVVAAAATMVALGFWQLERARFKDAKRAQYERALAMNSDVAWPTDPAAADRALFRHATIECARVLTRDAIAGRSLADQSGWMHIARCALAGGGEAEVAYGWSRRPDPAPWDGGRVGGTIGPAGKSIRLYAGIPAPGLEPAKAPDLSDMPNNSRSYAVQWFAFAGLSILIYGLALAGRRRAA